MSRFIQKHIDEASDAEICEFATQFLGIELTGSESLAEVMMKVRSAHEGDNIYVMERGTGDQTGTPPAKVPGTTEAGKLVGGLGRNDPKVTIVIHAEEREGVVNARHKEVGVNGVVWLVKRGEPVQVPYRVYLALNDAVRNNITHTDDGDVLEQRSHNTPFNVLAMPSPEEIAAWHARTKDVFCPA